MNKIYHGVHSDAAKILFACMSSDREAQTQPIPQTCVHKLHSYSNMLQYNSLYSHTQRQHNFKSFLLKNKSDSEQEDAAHLQQLKCLGKPNSFQQISHITGHCVIADGN